MKAPVAAVAVGGILLLAACGTTSSTSSTSAATPAPSSVPAPQGTESASASPTQAPATTTDDGVLHAEYLPGLEAQVRTAPTPGPAPLIVMVPGGGWQTADPSGLESLATRLTQDGETTSLITYQARSANAFYPTAIDQVACAVRWSAQQATEMGHPPSEVIVLGHSAGGHLASLVAFSGEEFGADCPYPPVTINGLIGLAGIYETDWYASYMAPWMQSTPDTDPAAWQRVDPMWWLENGDAIPEGFRVLLEHGDADYNVPLAQTTALADALRAKDIPVDATVFPGMEHLTIIEGGIAEPPIAEWMKGWTGSS